MKNKRNILNIRISSTVFCVLIGMRKRREIITDSRYHVTARVNRNEFIFEPPFMKAMFLQVIARAKKKYSFQLTMFTVMDNHIHMMIRPVNGESLSRIMQWILSVSARAYNKHYGLKGHVWYDRFKSVVIKSYRQRLAAFRYICNNPVKAKMVDSPENYIFGGLWYILHKRFEFIEPPDRCLVNSLPDLF